MSSIPRSDRCDYYVAFQQLGIGFRTLYGLHQHINSLEDLWYANADTLRGAGASREFTERFISMRASINPSELRTRFSIPGINILCIEDQCYPAILKETHSPPLVLYVRGTVTALSTPSCAVVGTRKPTPYGIAATHRLVEPLAAHGITIVSGLAYGIDGEAHRASLDAHGTTIGVLGNAIDEVYPRSHAQLAHDIIGHGGAIISEYPPQTTVQKHFFPQRNRIIAGLSAASLIIEAGRTSGALITAKMALDENRDVFAAPGPIDSEQSFGTNELLRQGATPATTAHDLFGTFGLDTDAVLHDTSTIRDDSDDVRQLLQLLATTRHIDELVAMSTLDTSAVNATLALLEVEGRVKHVGGMHYIRIA